MKQLAWFCLMTVPLTVSLTLLDGFCSRAFANPTGLPAATPSAPLLAAPRPGIWQEIVTTVDGVTVRKVRDTTGGDYNVCYIVSRQAETPLSPYKIDTTPAALSIACVPEKRP
jgi:hypothetical protein